MSGAQEFHEEILTGPDLHDVPLSALGEHAKEPLYAFLNSEKLLPSPDRHPRDWRGLAELAEIPGQYHSSIRDCSDHGGPTAKVLSMWIKKNDGSANVGRLQKYLQTLDRWDIYDDTKELFEEEANRYRQQLKRPIPTIQNAPDERITYDDVATYPKLQRYHAYVLYAQEDEAFALDLMSRLRDQGFKICSEADLLVGFTTQFEPVSRLLSERCQHIIVIYSPEFLASQANKFYMDYAQALGIETRTRKIVPCMYRECRLPASYSFYHMLYYSEGRAHSMYNFWDKLAKSLEIDSNIPRLPVAEAASDRALGAPPALALREPAAAAPRLLTPSPPAAAPAPTDTAPAPDPPQMNGGHDNPGALPIKSIGQLSISTKRCNKKPNILQKIFKRRGKKDKAKQLVEMCAS